MNELVNEIMEAQYNVLHHRIRYDRSVDDYNDFIRQNNEIMDQISDKDIREMPVFRIEE